MELILVLLLPLIMIAIGASQFAKAASTLSELSDKKRAAEADRKAFELQKNFYARNPGATQQDFLKWYTSGKLP